VTDPNSLGELIRERRLARGLSLGQLATAVGRTAATVRSWERGQHFPAADVVDRLADALQIEVERIDDLMYPEPPSLTVVGDTPDDDAVLSESTSVGGDVSVETADGEGDDDTAEAGEVSSAPAEAAAPESEFAAASADDLGIMPRVRPPAGAPSASEPSGPDGSPDEIPSAADESDGGAVVAAPPPVDAGVIGAGGLAAAAAGEAASLVDEPTAPIGPPIEAGSPAAGTAGPIGVAVRSEMLQEPDLPPFLAPLRAIFDPRRKWLYWIRGTLTVVVLLALLVVLGWAAGELFDGLGAVLDTIESTDTLSDGLTTLP
jgi:transcriptional regulator with XRE-family HTH domain